jgi:hypothetical protein
LASVTALLVVLAFVAGCITAVTGVWVGRGQSPVSLVLNWAAVTLVLQLFAACIAIFHARASGGSDAVLDEDQAPASRPGPPRDPPRPVA